MNTRLKTLMVASILALGLANGAMADTMEARSGSEAHSGEAGSGVNPDSKMVNVANISASNPAQDADQGHGGQKR